MDRAIRQEGTEISAVSSKCQTASEKVSWRQTTKCSRSKVDTMEVCGIATTFSFWLFRRGKRDLGMAAD